MKQQKGSTQTKKVLWRMSEASPQGEFVDVTNAATAAATAAAVAATPAVKDKPEITHGSWLESSFELLNGTEVNDGPDTVPDELFDELFAPAAVAQKTPEK